MINKIIYKQILFYIIWFFYLILPFLYIVRFYFFKNLSEQSTFFRYLLSIFLNITNFIPALLLILFLIHLKKFYINKLPKSSRKTLRIFLLISIAIIVVGMILLNMEQNNYPNYLYATFGLPYDVLDLMIKLNLFMVVTILFISITQGKELENLTRLLAIFAFVILISQSFYPLVNSNKLFIDSQAGPEEKYGLVFKDMPNLLQKTPDSSNFIHPPQQDALPFISNQPMLRYFLFPRTIVTGSLVKNQRVAESIKEAYFLDLGIYKAGKRWPIINLENKEITFNQKNKIEYKKLELIFKGKEGDLYKVYF